MASSVWSNLHVREGLASLTGENLQRAYRNGFDLLGQNLRKYDGRFQIALSSKTCTLFEELVHLLHYPFHIYLMHTLVERAWGKLAPVIARPAR